ncbi:solute carrier family 25 member 36-A-like [Notothenia coriiceps]|uniref:Solute carrier family 25 member 36-A-like n=1 Tax=Notothenia coriiceps TaxID=8208 RepID=A0A6I9P1Q5_9TELE|nr:PREDICTED: solute carrier family 25 member 36-A-like [Notothenia coriiceps]
MSQRDTLVHLFAGGLNSRHALWALFLGRFNFTLTYRPGSRIVKADALSRQFAPPVEDSTKETMLPSSCVVGAAKAIYFAAYSTAKEKLNGVFEPDSTQVHMVSAGMAGFTAITATNPIWLIKTRLQLDARNRGERRMSAFECMRRVYRTDGLRGFYRGMSASYAGISETVIHFVIYENIKRRLMEAKATQNMDEEEETSKDASDFIGMMLAAATSKTCATTLAYPHEVIRTRLREEGTKYNSFFQTLRTVPREEGYRALYRGLTTHLVRQIPNTAIVISTYELVVYLLNG